MMMENGGRDRESLLFSRRNLTHLRGSGASEGSGILLSPPFQV